MNKFIELLKTITFKTFNGMFFRNKNRIVLNKDNDYNNLKVKFSNKFVNAKNSTQIELMSQNIKNFLIVMTRDCKNFKSGLLLNNFKKTLFDIYDIKEKDDNMIGGKVTTIVKNKDKVLEIKYKINSFSVCNHELLHLSTLNLLLSGFENNFLDKPIGKGLDEGYTQLLTERYFNESVGKAYFFLTYFCKLLEIIIGQDKMETYYFNTSLLSLITDLEQYENKENIINFIKNLDLLIDINLEKIDDPTLDQIDSFQNTVDKVIEFLLSCFKRKIDTILTDELIEDKDEYIESILYNTFYVNALVDFPKSSNIKEYRVKLFSREKSDELFEYTDEQLGSLETNKKR